MTPHLVQEQYEPPLLQSCPTQVCLLPHSPGRPPWLLAGRLQGIGDTHMFESQGSTLCAVDSLSLCTRNWKHASDTQHNPMHADVEDM